MLVNELAAHLSQHQIEPTLMQKVVAAIRNALRKMGLAELANYNDADMLRVVSKAKQAVITGKNGTIAIAPNAMQGKIPAHVMAALMGDRSAFMTAWHGSPHTFDKFSTEKIGTGEGAQAYGHGLYFAGAKEVAEHYKDTLGIKEGAQILKEGRNNYSVWGRKKGDAQISLISEGLLYGKAVALKEEWDKKNAGRLYQVELAPKEEDYLLWDKPLSEQSEKVKKALYDSSFAKDVDSRAVGKDIYLAAALDDSRGIENSGYKAASDYLHSLGIRGIKYLDGSSRGNGEGSYNYVLFSDKDVEITAMFMKKPAAITESFKQPSDKTVVGSAINAFDAVKAFTNQGTRNDAADYLRTSLVDKFNPVKKSLGEEVYRIHRLLNNSAATLGTFLQHGKLSWNGNALDITTKNEGFVPWLKSLGEDGQNFLYWVSAKRAGRLAMEGRENWLTPQRRVEIIKYTTNDGAKTKQFEDWNKTLQEYNKNIIDIAQDAGLINPDSRARWMSDYYLPFYRVLENPDTAEEFLRAPSMSKKFIDARVKQLKGGESMLGDPMENIIHNWAHLITEAQSNVARRSAAEVAVPAGIATVVKPSALAKLIGAQTDYIVKDDTGDILETFDKKSDAEQYALANHGTVSEKSVLKFGTKEDHKILSYQENGKPVYIQVEDRALYDALGQVNPKIFDNNMIKVFGAAKRLLTAGATFGAGFRIANLLRDTIHTSVVSKSFVPFADTAKGLVQVWRKSDDYISLMASAGGFAQGYLDSGDPQSLAKSINKIVEREGKGAKGRILDSPRKALEFWERIGHASEMAARVQLYTNLKAKGEGHAEAAFKARDLLDFTLSGQSQAVRTATAMIPFLNARVQGLDRLYRGYKEDPKAFLLKGSLLTMASLALWGANKDDDRYKGLEDWDKWQYYHFWIGDEHFRIPKPFEVGAIFSTMFESAADSMAGDESFKYFTDMLTHTLTQTFALGAPALISPSIEVWANKSSFTGREIESIWDKDIPAGLRSKPWTPQILKDIGKSTNISPLKMEHLLRGHMATFATMFFGISDLMYDRPEQSFAETTGLNRFVKSGPENTKYATRFYDFAEEMAKMVNEVKYYQASGDMEMARTLADENRDSIRMKRFVNLTKTQLSRVRKQETATWESTTLSAKEKRVRLDALRETKNGIYKRAYDKIYGQ